MICSCGARYPDSDKACTYCGARNTEYEAPIPAMHTDAKNTFDPRAAFPGLKQAQQQDAEQGFSWEENQNNQRYQEKTARSANISATVSLVCGILGNIYGAPIFGTIAVILGRRAKRLGYPGGKATAGIVLGIFALIFWLFVMFMVTNYIPRNLPHLMPYINRIFFL